ncbi:MAG TPA: TRAM domain-containing protein [Armatimonadota bacterium]|nr:TRAM domain-containing protein [Armatimonadota bacterium]
MGLRIFGFMFSAVIAFATSVIGHALAKFFLAVVENNAKLPLSPLYKTLTPVGVVFIFAIIGFYLGTRLFRGMAEVANSLKRIPAEDKIASTFGTLISLIPVVLVWAVTLTLVNPDHFPMLALVAVLLLASVFIIWLGNVIALSMKDEMKFLLPGRPSGASAAAPAAGATPKLLDTNVIIDGRIYDICRAGFLEGSLILPGFVLEELHHIADSADALRRNRGRRGLDILHQLQTEMEGSLRILDRYKVTFAPGDGVDIKLVKLAKAMGADIVTNDYNLNKVAKLHGVRVLNINELANAVKPVVLPGEELVVTIVREGKEYNQGVGYLDDGTMVVVENGKKMLGDTVAVTVSSVLQTVAGKMIFADLKFEGQEDSDDGSGSYSGRGGRRKTT